MTEWVTEWVTDMPSPWDAYASKKLNLSLLNVRYNSGKPKPDHEIQVSVPIGRPKIPFWLG